MAKVEKTNKPVKKTSNKQNKIIENYKNPVDTIWGKVIIWVLLFAMVGVIILGLVLAIISATN